MSSGNPPFLPDLGRFNRCDHAARISRLSSDASMSRVVRMMPPSRITHQMFKMLFA
jgi:hypothetical protein